MDRWVTIGISLGMAVIAMIGLYYQKVQVDGASGRLITELNDKLERLQASVNERFTRVEQPQKVAALEKQISDLKLTLASLETRYRAPEEQRQLTELSSYLTQRQKTLTEALKEPHSTVPSKIDQLTQPPLPSQDWSWMHDADRKKLDAQLAESRKIRDLFKSVPPLDIAPLEPPAQKSAPERLWETIKANPVVVGVVLLLLVFANRK
jgi:hypothetical protein